MMVEQIDSIVRCIGECLVALCILFLWYSCAQPKTHKSNQVFHITPNLNKVYTQGLNIFYQNRRYDVMKKEAVLGDTYTMSALYFHPL